MTRENVFITPSVEVQYIWGIKSEDKRKEKLKYNKPDQQVLKHHWEGTLPTKLAGKSGGRPWEQDLPVLPWMLPES